tara:strand:- start:1273 stop:1500 length:228 start_codon:yes stop_codon:yes gene_type:complete
MTYENFRHAMDDADENGAIDIEEVVGIKGVGAGGEVHEHSLPPTFKRSDILPHLKKYPFIVFYDKYGNGYSRIIY